ncbi:MAG: adenine phosphoribosyltransferase [Spirochaetales bacterium]|nr:MAG: adenine phosphoribosyltransferase [Spirochaetales bacterium]
MSTQYNLDNAIRKIPDYPKKGILFYDITSILTNPEAFQYCVSRMVDIYRNTDVAAVAGIESRGFIFAAPLADRLGIPLILVRKAGKLPGDTWREDYQLEYGQAAVEIHKSDVPAGKDVLLIDDLIATGGTLSAAKSILEKGGARVKNVFGIIGLSFLNYQEKLPGVTVTTLVNYESETV